jgi:hypothetical protein
VKNLDAIGSGSFNPASMRSHSRPVLRARSPTRPHRTLKIPDLGGS